MPKSDDLKRYYKKMSKQPATLKNPEVAKMYKKLGLSKVTLKPEVTKKFKALLEATKAPVAKKVVAKKIIGKVLRKFIPGVGAAIIAHDIVKGVSKSTCSKRGGKWVSGKCVGTKKTKLKAGSKVRDPISKR